MKVSSSISPSTSLLELCLSCSVLGFCWGINFCSIIFSPCWQLKICLCHILISAWFSPSHYFLQSPPLTSLPDCDSAWMRYLTLNLPNPLLRPLTGKMFLSRWQTRGGKKKMYSVSGGVRQPLTRLSQDVIKHLDESTALCCQTSLQQSQAHGGEFPVTASSTESRRPKPLLKILSAGKEREGSFPFKHVLGEWDNVRASDLPPSQSEI